MSQIQIVEPTKQLNTIEDVFGISETRMKMIEEIVRFDLRPNCSKLGDLLYAVAYCNELSEQEKVYAAYKVTRLNSRGRLGRLLHG